MVNQPLVKKRNGALQKRSAIISPKTFRKWIESNKSKTASYAMGNSIFVMNSPIIMMFQ
jgi:hypothetical protein